MSSPSLAGQFRGPAIPVLRLVFAIVGAASFVLGFVGLEQYLVLNQLGQHTVVDLLYFDLQLFVLDSTPLEGNAGARYPPALQVARFAAPAATVLAVVEAGRVILASELRRVRLRRRSGHAVVCGDSAMAQALVNRLQDEHDVVIWVYPQPIRVRKRRRTFIVAGDPADTETLRDAGVARARVLYACTDDSAANASIALAAAQLVRRRAEPLNVYAQVHDHELCLALQARRLGQHRPTGLHLDFFNVSDLAARMLFVTDPLRPFGGQSPMLLVAGASTLGLAIIVAACRHWRVRRGSGMLRIHLVDEGASLAAEQLKYRYPFMDQVCVIKAHDAELPVLLSNGDLSEVPDRIYLCLNDEELGLKTALTLQTLWQGTPRSVLVRLNRLSGFTEAFHGRSGDGLLDEVSGKLRLYREVEAAADPTLIAEDLVEQLARTIHEHYVAKRRERGEVGDGHVGWDELDDQFRTANRSQAEEVGSALRRIGCILAPRVPGGTDAVLTDAEVQLLAESEHARWRRERTARGWQAGARDDDSKLHPDLSGWAELTEPAREKNRDAVRELPAILAEAGFQIVRINTMTGTEGSMPCASE